MHSILPAYSAFCRSLSVPHSNVIYKYTIFTGKLQGATPQIACAVLP
ncbi:hypothetical protein RUMCAL_02897 [Ruminococcus callidus ATCC 27760]|uniref:Uncharacterized protein n=1 Tax=Ruminococcus callidus ATCC 27760 TaxID=411473 RepID=U2KCI4_9FIRM|nr:hypothetical protein RUMCAL_02897 [Ruminococcus callidus ATCC 27760]